MPMRKPAIPEKKNEKTVLDKTLLPEDNVRLKPILGIKPGHYLACLYAAVILLVLFFILLYPGIKNPGSVLVVKTEPWGAAVFVDGVYRDAAPCEIFVPKGRHQIELSLPGFNPSLLEKDMKGRLFASALFPLKIKISEKLFAPDPAKAFITEAAEYAAWAFTGEPGVAYQVPLSLSEGAYRLSPYAASDAMQESQKSSISIMEDTIIAAARFAVTRNALRDLLRAKTLLDNQGLSPSPVSLLESAGDIINYLAENNQTAIWLGSLLTGEAQSVLTASSWFEEAANKKMEDPDPVTGNSIRAGGLNFRRIQVGRNLDRENANTGENLNEIEAFYICETLITEPAWDAFLEQQPGWKKENIQSLLKEGLVREDYLETVPGAPASGVSAVSWYAAKAFCQWLGASLPPDLEARLPTEAEWTIAAKAAFPSGGAVMDYGLFWEWCEDPFAPLNYLSAPAEAIAALGSPERSLKGGSWVNPRGSVVIETRASLPPAFCSGFVSFRPVIVPKGNEL